MPTHASGKRASGKRANSKRAGGKRPSNERDCNNAGNGKRVCKDCIRRRTGRAECGNANLVGTGAFL